MLVLGPMYNGCLADAVDSSKSIPFVPMARVRLIKYIGECNQTTLVSSIIQTAKANVPFQISQNANSQVFSESATKVFRTLHFINIAFPATISLISKTGGKLASSAMAV